MATRTARAASHKQLTLLIKLRVEVYGEEYDEAKADIEAFDPTMDEASRAISQLIDIQRRERAAARDAAAPQSAHNSMSVECPEGMHRYDGRIFKVQHTQDGRRLYAKELVEAEDGRPLKFEYSAGTIKHLSKATMLPLEEAQDIGRTFGVCCVCCRTLESEYKAMGIGPVCIKKFR